MRKLSITACLLLAVIFVHAQKKELNNAYNSYLNGYHDRAKTAIDKAILNDDTKNDAKAWLYRGNIYLRIANSKENPKEKEYHNLCDNCAEIAYEAYLKALELDPAITVTNMGITDPKQGLKFCAGYLYNEAYKLFDSQQYEEAYSVLGKANKADGTQEYILFLLAYTAEITKRTDIAKAHYNEMLRRKSKDIKPYQRLVNIYKLENDTAKVLNVMKAGEPIFLKDSIQVDYAIIYSIALSWAGETDEATEIMDKALEQYPDNHILLINYGSELSNQKKYKDAEKYLKRAVELQPDEPIAIYNLGNCYYNNAVDKKKSARDIEDDKEYDRQMEEATSLLEQARPYIEKAHEMDSKDRNTLIMLKGIYAELGLEEELKAIDEKIKELGR